MRVVFLFPMEKGEIVHILEIVLELLVGLAYFAGALLLMVLIPIVYVLVFTWIDDWVRSKMK